MCHSDTYLVVYHVPYDFCYIFFLLQAFAVRAPVYIKSDGMESRPDVEIWSLSRAFGCDQVAHDFI